jgi:hypothetical protein
MTFKNYLYIYCLLIFVASCSPIDNSSPLPEDFFVKFYGDRDEEKGLEVLLRDNGYLIMGSTTSQNLTKRGDNDSDFYLVLTDFEGNEIASNVIGDEYNQVPGNIKATSDGGYIMIGTTSSEVGPTQTLQRDIIVYKLDADGVVSAGWPIIIDNMNTTLTSDEFGADIIEDTDGGFILVGTTSSVDITKAGYNANTDGFDIYLHKILADGTRDWELTFGFVGNDRGKAIIQTTSGGLAILGETEVDKDGAGGGSNIIFATTNAAGGANQFRAYGSSDDRNDYPSEMRMTNDGGFIIVGTSSVDNQEDLTNDIDGEDNRIILMKVTINRTLTYFETLSIGELSEEGVRSGTEFIAGNGIDVIGLSTGGFLIAGKRIGGKIDQDDSGVDMFLIKTNSFGQITNESTGDLLDGLWEKNYGGLGDDQANSILELSDGKLIIAGTNDFGGTNSTMMTLMKLNRSGELLR